MHTQHVLSILLFPNSHNFLLRRWCFFAQQLHLVQHPKQIPLKSHIDRVSSISSQPLLSIHSVHSGRRLRSSSCVCTVCMCNSVFFLHSLLPFWKSLRIDTQRSYSHSSPLTSYQEIISQTHCHRTPTRKTQRNFEATTASAATASSSQQIPIVGKTSQENRQLHSALKDSEIQSEEKKESWPLSLPVENIFSRHCVFMCPAWYPAQTRRDSDPSEFESSVHFVEQKINYSIWKVIRCERIGILLCSNKNMLNGMSEHRE